MQLSELYILMTMFLYLEFMIFEAKNQKCSVKSRINFLVENQ